MRVLRGSGEQNLHEAGVPGILLLEDSPLDAELVQAQLYEGGISCELVWVQTRTDFVVALEERRFDLILSDYALPGFDGLSALAKAREICPEAPFIFVSGTLGDELAIKTLKNGATDYVLKDHLQGLVPAVQRALSEAKERREHERAEEALRKSEQRFRTLVEQIPAVTYTQQTTEPGSSRTNPTLYASPQIEEQSGYPPQAFVEDSELWIRLLHPEDRERVLAEDRRTDETGEPFRMEYRQIARDGRITWIRDEAVLVRDEDGTPRFWQGVMFDITERRHAEQALRESEERFRSLVRYASDMIEILDAEGTIIYESPAVERMLGFRPEERVGTDALDYIHQDDVDMVRREFAEILRNPRSRLSVEYRICSKNGDWRLLEAIGANLLDDPTIRGIVLNTRDITERKEAEEKYRSIFENAVEGIFQTTVDRRFSTANPALARMFGYASPEELLEAISSIGDQLNLDPGRREEFYELALRDGFVSGFEIQALREDGTLIWASVNARAIYDEKGAIIGFEGTVEDITERKEAEEALRKSEERFRLMIEQSPLSIQIFSPDGSTLRVNQAWERLWGVTLDQIPDYNVLRDPQLVEKGIMPYIEQCFAGEAAALPPVKYEPGETIQDVSDVSHRWVRGLIYPVKDEAGGIQEVVLVHEDITERRHAEEALRQSGDLYHAVIEQAAECIFLVDVESKRILETNASLPRMLGYTREELQEMTIYDVVAHDQESIDNNIRHILEQKHYTMPERRYRRKDGSLVDVEVNVTVVPYGDRETICVVTHDVTEHKRVEKELRQSLSVLLALREAGEVLGSTLESEEIATRLLEIMKGVSGLTAAVISLPQSSGKDFRIWRSVGLDELWPDVRFDPGAENARWAALEGQDHQLVPLSRPAATQSNTLEALFLPIKVKDRVIGVLEAYGRASLGASAHIYMQEVLRSLAHQAASALENAQLYEELGERERALHNLVEQLLGTQEEERRRVAYEVHDGLAQVAVAAHQNLQAFARRHAPVGDKGRRELDRILTQVRATVSDARRVIANLRPTVLDDLGLAAAISVEIEHLIEEGYQVEYEDHLGDERLPGEMEITLFRVAQEALTNMRKHAETRSVSIELRRRDGAVYLEVRDFGRGFDLAMLEILGGGPGERVGFAGMRERVGMLGGELEIHSRPGAGTSVAATIPLKQSV